MPWRASSGDRILLPYLAVGFDIDEVRNFDDLLFLRLAPVRHEVALVAITVQFALCVVLHIRVSSKDQNEDRQLVAMRNKVY